jgi:ankyrin repeat protein
MRRSFHHCWKRGGADVNAKEARYINKKTPLHDASIYGHENIVSLLLEKSADVNDKSNSGYTPLHCARKHQGHEDIVSLLLLERKWRRYECPRQ